MRSIIKFGMIIFLVSSVFAHADRKRKTVPSLPKKPNLEETFSENNFKRVDPHGSAEFKLTAELVLQKNECLVCHSYKNAHLAVKVTALTSCFNCHNQSPHSGVQEHLKHNISCVDCHSVHRSGASSAMPSSGLFKNTSSQEIEMGFIQKKATSGMLKKSCVNCHKF